MAEKVTNLKGTRDILPQDMLKRNYIFDTIKNVFQKFGYQQIETPSMEKTSTLMGKYGEEGDNLIFKVMNQGEKVGKADMEAYNSGNLKRFALSLSERAMRYDLTVPFARFVVQHQNELAFPFKRFQIQPVWRGDRPQKGRYQEFYQCDADVVGSDSLIFEVEFIQIFDEVLSSLQIPDFTIKINNRKILTGIAQLINKEDQIVDLTVAIDKLDKIGKDGVIKELESKGFSKENIKTIDPLFHFEGSNQDKIKALKNLLENSIEGQKGIEEMEFILNQIDLVGLQSAKLELDVTLARGLNYYTGAIFEVKANNVSIGSICGGGRYDDLTGLFGLNDLSGVGISFGADRIYDVLEELNLFPDSLKTDLDVLFINFGENEFAHCFKLATQLRKEGFKVEVYPESSKLKKQFSYADKRGVRYTALIGADEIKAGKFQMKNMVSGEQTEVDYEGMKALLK
ncbi:MAG: histidine--tRNA ligase [Crocinitomicaceae bacterium]|nr:histidine--tRNA ligase [Crocinitomicaceae bacterium]